MKIELFGLAHVEYVEIDKACLTKNCPCMYRESLHMKYTRVVMLRHVKTSYFKHTVVFM